MAEERATERGGSAQQRPAVPFDLDTTDRLLSTTRSVRRRLDLERPVEPEVIHACLRLAVQAPTGSNQQGWRWVVVTDPELRARIGELYRAGGEAYLRAAAEAAGHTDERRTADGGSGPAFDGSGEGGGDRQQRRVQDSAEYLVRVIDQVPVLVIPCLRGRITEVRQAASFMGSILPAVWNFQLALRSRGLGSVLTTFHLAYEQEAAELLGIPDDVTQVALLPVAYTLGTDFRPAHREPVERITYWNGYGDRRE